MTIEQALEHALNGEAVLFLGSGFSLGATNILNKSFLNGAQLTKLLLGKINISEEQVNLRHAAEIFVEQSSDEELANLLRGQFSVKVIADHHKSIGAVHWFRIFTTNYDNVLERAYAENSRQLVSVTLGQDPSQFVAVPDLCLHINGDIGSLTPDSLFDSFKLTDTSYLTDTFRGSLWGDFFRTQLRHAQAIFFLGTSLGDIDITRILYEERAIKDKCFLITNPQPSKVDQLILAKYGTVLPWGMEKFSRILDEKKRSWNPARYEPVRIAFEEIKKPNDIRITKDQDAFNLFLRGEVDRGLVYKSLLEPGQNPPYYVLRSNLAIISKYAEQKKKTFLITSSLGNGKTLLCLGIAHKALLEGYKVFWLKPEYDDYHINRDITSLCRDKEPIVVVVENYYRYLKNLHYLRANRTSKVILILTARTDINDHYYDRLLDALDQKPVLLDVDQIDDSAADQIISILDHFSFWGKHAAKSFSEKKRVLDLMNNSFQRLLLELLKSPDISSRFLNVLREIEQMKDGTGAVELIVASCALSLLLGHEVTISSVSDILETDVVRDARIRQHAGIREIIRIGRDSIELQSSVFSQFILSSISDSTLLINSLIKIAKRAERLGKNNSTYYWIFRELVRFSNLQMILPERQRRPMAINFYEALKNLDSTKEHPHFWLQYAIARLSFPDLDEAGIYFENSYAYAEKLGNYNTRQIDNHFARYLLERSKAEGDADKAYRHFIKAHELLMPQFNQTDLYYPYRVAKGYYGFFFKHFKKLASEQKSEFLLACQMILEGMRRLDFSVMNNRFVKECKNNLQEIMKMKERGLF